jgi:hypothetical protein
VSLAQAHERAGKWDKAIEAYETILKRFPTALILIMLERQTFMMQNLFTA